MFCIGNVPDEGTFLKLVKKFLRGKGLAGFMILAYCESPVGSLREEMERDYLNAEQEVAERYQEWGETNSVVALFIPSIQRYVA